MQVRPGRAEDRPVVGAFLDDHNALLVARRGELVESLHHPALVAWAGDELVGVATYVLSANGCELLTLHARGKFMGTGSALLAAVVEVARTNACQRLWVVTTNDNVDALRFYQRRGFRLAHLRAGAVNESRRTLKPAIPVIGSHGIALRDELELELDLRPADEG
jgi:N-acetylglutamate synthase-like GNAT family acetyltransferase